MASKKYQYYTTAVPLPNGTRKYVRGKTKEELEKKVLELKIELNLGVNVVDNTTFGELALLWYKVYKEPVLRESSKASLKHNINKHILPILSGYEVREIKPFHIQQVMTSVACLSHSTQQKILQIMRSVFQMAEDNGIIAKSPVLSTMKAHGKKADEKEPLTREQSDALLKATWGTRAYTFVLIALNSGLRRGEILGLMWQDIDLEKKILHVRHNLNFSDKKVTTFLKTDSSKRDIPIPSSLCLHLEHCKAKAKSLYVFSKGNGEPLTESSFRSMWRIVEKRTTFDMEKFGKPISPKHPKIFYSLDFHCHPHLLRHTYITRLFESGLDIKQVQYLAGHSTIEMTLKVYTHYDRISRNQETTEKIERAFPLSDSVLL